MAMFSCCNLSQSVKLPNTNYKVDNFSNNILLIDLICFSVFKRKCPHCYNTEYYPYHKIVAAISDETQSELNVGLPIIFQITKFVDIHL